MLCDAQEGAVFRLVFLKAVSCNSHGGTRRREFLLDPFLSCFEGMYQHLFFAWYYTLSALLKTSEKASAFLSGGN